MTDTLLPRLVGLEEYCQEAGKPNGRRQAVLALARICDLKKLKEKLCERGCVVEGDKLKSSYLSRLLVYIGMEENKELLMKGLHHIISFYGLDIVGRAYSEARDNLIAGDGAKTDYKKAQELFWGYQAGKPVNVQGFEIKRAN